LSSIVMSNSIWAAKIANRFLKLGVLLVKVGVNVIVLPKFCR
jgi:peptidoglycan biosynthesis protein MviN/MurJ (putative lipid II flippase)